MRFCPNMKLIMVSQWQEKKNLDLLHVRCKQWTCPYCAPVNARVWKNYILNRLAKEDFRGKDWCMLTITAHENAHKAGALYTLKNLQNGFKRLYHRLKRWNGGGFEYLRIFEKHTEGKYGGFHMHIIADLGATHSRKKVEFLHVLEREKRAKKQGKKPRKRLKKEIHPQRWLINNARACGMGYEADFKYIGNIAQRTASYMTKYISKQLDILEFPPHMRRVQSSRRFGSPKRKDGGNVRNWKAKAAIFREDLNSYEKIIDLTMKRIVTLEEDFSHGELWYPPELK